MTLLGEACNIGVTAAGSSPPPPRARCLTDAGTWMGEMHLLLLLEAVSVSRTSVSACSAPMSVWEEESSVCGFSPPAER